MEYYRLMDGQSLAFLYRLDRSIGSFERYVGKGSWVPDSTVAEHHFGLVQDYVRETVTSGLEQWQGVFDDRLNSK